ncbi:hypothetical protein PINS_up003050 [Pythium insidiosum]|nr:hypothetical protein PINS_up003050 [Pythium insidiosum]
MLEDPTSLSLAPQINAIELEKVFRSVLGTEGSSLLDWSAFRDIITLNGMERSVRYILVDKCADDFTDRWPLMIDQFTAYRREGGDTEAVREWFREAGVDLSKTDAVIVHEAVRIGQLRGGDEALIDQVKAKLALICRTATPQWLTIEPFVRRRTERLRLLVQHASSGNESKEHVTWDVMKERLRL